jgi:hypothetical protein
VTQTFPLEEAETAHQMILANKISGRAAWVILVTLTLLPRNQQTEGDR